MAGDINYGAILESLNNKVDLSGSWSAPSGQYVDLTLAASGSTYVAPADGIFCFQKRTSVPCQSVFIVMRPDDTTKALYRAPGGTDQSGTAGGCWCVVKKGLTVRLEWDQNGDLIMFRFIYAQKTN